VFNPTLNNSNMGLMFGGGFQPLNNPSSKQNFNMKALQDKITMQINKEPE
jgi:hypothetical protein